MFDARLIKINGQYAVDLNSYQVILPSLCTPLATRFLPPKDEGVEKTKEMIDYLHKADSTQIVICGFNLMVIANPKKDKGICHEDGGMSKEAKYVH